MRIRGLLVAALVLAALSGVLYWSNHRKPEGSAKPAADAPPKILSLNEADIISVAIRKKGQPAVVLTKSGGTWRLSAPVSLEADASAVSGVIGTVSSVSSERLVDDKPSDLGQYGLADPPLEVEISAKDKTQKLLLGEATVNGSANYAALAGDPRVFTIATYIKSALDKTASDLRDARLLTLDFDKVSEVELSNKKSGKAQDITFARDKDSWQILKPKPIRADASQVNGLVQSLRDARLDRTSADDQTKNASLFSAGTPYAAVKIAAASGTQELQVRKNKDDYYVNSSILEGRYKIPSGTATALDKSLEDFRNKKLFDFGFNEPERIEIHDGSKAYYLTHSGSDWWDADGKKLDSTTVEPLLEKLRDLASVKFPDSGFAAPGIEITVMSNGGKLTEKVAIAKAGVNYLAKREGDSGLYELGAVAVDGMLKTASEVKAEPPVAAANKKK
jgi:hypothetical protein